MGVEDIRWCEGGNASISPKLLAASKCVLYTVKCILYSVHCNMYKNVQFDTPNITPVECLKFDAIHIWIENQRPCNETNLNVTIIKRIYAKCPSY